MRPHQLEILYEDDLHIAVNKPAGIAVIPERVETDAPDLIGLMRERFEEVLVVHRLDRETSGVILFARSADAHHALNDQFQNSEARKLYHALVYGAPLWEEQSVDLPLRVNGDRRHRTIVDPGKGRPASTTYRVLERLGPYSWVEARPKTGRTHQIRVHLAAVGAPIAVDPLYGIEEPVYLSAFKRNYTPGAREERPLLARLGLHASALTVRHAESGADITIEAPLPKDLRATLNQLRKHTARG